MPGRARQPHRQPDRVFTLDERVDHLETGWLESARLMERVVRELRALQSHLKDASTALDSIVILETALQEVFAMAGEKVATAWSED